MNIGIDIDDTLTEVQEELEKAALRYAMKIGKNINSDSINLEEDLKSRFGFTDEELKFFLKSTHEKITNRAKPRKNAVEVIQKLQKEGHKIIIVTARSSEFHDNPYLLSENWLKKNNITYDKLIVNAKEKGSICKEENIDIFIDDQLKNCLDVLKQGIKVIRIGKDLPKREDIVTVENWKQIEQQIKKGVVANEEVKK